MSQDRASSPIGIMDSGVGGLSVVREIQRLMPHEQLIYVADSAHAPYGEKSAAYVQARVLAIADFLLSQGAKALVLACNTATAMAVEVLRAKVRVPVIAMEPALKPAAHQTKSGVVGVLATQGTLQSERFARLHDAYGHQVRFFQRACHHWVRQVERGELHSPLTLQLVRAEVEPLLAAGADVLVLGCTHYPFLREQIQAVAGEAVQIIDPAPAVARHLRQCLLEADALQPEAVPASLRIYTSGSLESLQALLTLLDFQADYTPERTEV